MISILDLCEAVSTGTVEPEVAIQKYLEKFFPGKARKSKWKYKGIEVPNIVDSIQTSSTSSNSICVVFVQDGQIKTGDGRVLNGFGLSQDRIKLRQETIEFFQSLGYHCREGHFKDGYYDCHFDAIHTVPVTHKIRSEEKYLFHVSPSFNDDLITQQGFVPKNLNKQASFHGNRIYFVLGSINDSYKGFSLTRILRALKTSARNHASDLGKKKKDFDLYTVYKLSVAKIPNQVHFYEDPENEEEYVYTYDAIPASAIVEKYQENLKGKGPISVF